MPIFNAYPLITSIADDDTVLLWDESAGAVVQATYETLISDIGSISRTSAILDGITTTVGAMLYRGVSVWQELSPGVSGLPLVTQGIGSAPIFTPNISGLLIVNSAFNGTVGQLTPAAAAFTTVFTTGNATLNSLTTGNAIITGGSITGMPTPTQASDVATKAYADGISAGITIRTGVTVATTANITLSGEQTIDGVLTSATRILVKNQSLTQNNGIYVTGAGAWTRATDSDTAAELGRGYTYFVSSGTTQGGSNWTITTPPTVLGTDPVVFTQFSGSATYSAGTGLLLVGSVFSINTTQTGLTINSSAFNGTVGASTPGTGAFTRLGLGLLAPTTLAGITNNASGLPTPYSTTQVVVHVGNTDAVAPAILVDGSGAGGLYEIRRANGTQASPSALLSGDLIGTIGWRGYGTNAFTNRRVEINALTTQTWTNSAQGTKLEFKVTATGGTTTATALTVTSTGINSTPIGATTPDTGKFTTVTMTGSTAWFGPGGTGVTPVALVIDAGSGANSGAEILLKSNSLTRSYIGAQSIILGGSSDNLIIGSVADNVIIQASGTTCATFDQFGMNGVIGFTTPAAATFTTTNWSSNANKRTTKSNLNITVVNVKDYGATGDGTTNDSAAISSARAALTNRSTLYFPPGKYRITSTFGDFSSLSYITVTGEGAEIYNDTGAAGLNTFVFDSTCSNVQVTGLRLTGTSTVRGNGIHIRMYCSDSSITNCYIQGCSDFGIHVANTGSTWSQNVVVANNIIEGTLGDGIHIGNVTDCVVTGNTITSTGDDGIGIIADNSSYVPTRITVTGNNIYNAGGAATGVSGCGIRCEEVIDVILNGNLINLSYEAGIDVSRYLSTTAFNYRVTISNNKVIGACHGGAGPLGAIWLNFGQGITVSNNMVDDNYSGNGIAFLDCNDLVIQGNQLRNIPSRGIGSDDSTTTNVAANCYRVSILNNVIEYSLANQAIYCVAPVGKTINNMVIAGNVAGAVPAGDYIYYNRVTTGRVYNNLQQAANTIGAGGTVSGVSAGNNN